MRTSWARAWIAAVGLLAAASAIARTRNSVLLSVEKPVMDWLLDGTDTTIWDRTAVFSADWLLIGGTIMIALIGFLLEIRVGIAVVVTSLFTLVLTQLVSSIVGRTSPQGETGTWSFPDPTIAHTGVFWGLVVLLLWWVGTPKLIWQIVLELAVVMTLLVSIRLIVAAQIWPSDAAGSAIIIAVALITTAIVLEANPPQLPTRNRDRDLAAA